MHRKKCVGKCARVQDFKSHKHPKSVTHCKSHLFVNQVKKKKYVEFYAIGIIYKFIKR